MSAPSIGGGIELGDPLFFDRRLDAASEFDPGHGRAELGLYAEDAAGGVTLDYEQRLTEAISVFGNARAGISPDGIDYGAAAGLRWSF